MPTSTVRQIRPLRILGLRLIEDAKWRIWLDSAHDVYSKERRRAKIWHLEGYASSKEIEEGVEDPYRWEVKDGRRLVASGEAPSLEAAVASVLAQARLQGWRK